MSAADRAAHRLRKEGGWISEGLEATARKALVTAAITDAWEDLRGKVARRFGRGQADPVIERRLDATRKQIFAALAGELAQVQADAAGVGPPRHSLA
ncbi:MAG TPA: hypothetical protein VHZ03_15295 [Trebonia sp.]|nr:hypothetical protein [Trebonia sp.]